MIYSELLARLFNINQTIGMKFGLDNIIRLSKAMGSPEKSFKSVHIAGTNGKGSVTTKIASGLALEGFKVGLYTSPHISCFRERIRVNGKMIPEEKVVELLQKIFAIMDAESIPATFFEITTIVAFLHFAECNIDYGIIETGLGGRLDATNILMPELSIITSISLEHTEILGKNIKEIAKEKAGIIKNRVPVLIGPRVPFNIINEVATLNNSPLHHSKGLYSDFDQENCAISGRALDLLGVGDDSIINGLMAMPPCRLELVPNKINTSKYPEAVILDVGHNPDGLKSLFRALKHKFPLKPIRVVCGLSKNKDIDGCIKILKKNAKDFHLVHTTNGRGLPAYELKPVLLSQGVSESQIFIDSTIAKSVEKAIDLAYDNGQILVICGTFFIMSEARKALGIDEPNDPLNLN